MTLSATPTRAGPPIRLLLAPTPSSLPWTPLCERGAACEPWLLTWTNEPPSVDAGMPPTVADTLADAIGAIACAVFFTDREKDPVKSTHWQKVAEGWTCHPRPPLARRLLSARGFPLLASCQPRTIAKAFGDERFRWENQAQCLFLLSPETPPPEFPYSWTRAIFQRPLTAQLLAELSTHGIRALLAPGVDGDFIEIELLDTEFKPRLLTSLAAACSHNGLVWKQLDSATFLGDS